MKSFIYIGLSALLAFLLIVGCSSVSQPIDSTNPSSDNCSSLAVPSSVQLAAAPSWQAATDVLPRYCQVRGSIANRPQFELRLPEQWNSRFMMAGCGGFCGEVHPDKPGYSNSINEALKRGYAAISHDGGHQAPSWDASWAYDDPEALNIWAQEILPMVTAAGMAMTSAFYGKAPDYKYFSGCSTGGRLGLIAAQRYPDLFDGIASGCPTFNLRNTAGLWGNWMINQTYDGDKRVIPTTKVALIKQKVMAQCDGLDGQVDNIITEPLKCELDFTAWQCADGDTVDQCLTSAEAKMLNSVYGGVRNGKGEVIQPTLLAGSEHYSDIWLFGSEEDPGWGVMASIGYRQLLSNTLFGKDTSTAVATDELVEWLDSSSIPALTDPMNPDLSGLEKSGAKFIIYHGWSDPLVISEPILNYYGKAVEHAGSLDKLQKNTRLFMVPGMGHCWERPAESPAKFDPLIVLEQWVEKGEVPEFFVAVQEDEQGQLLRARPVCAYPKVSKLIAGNDPDKAESYQCIDMQ